jgi:hypothetical protein
MSENAEPTLRELGERGDIIKRIHRGLAERGMRGAPIMLAGEPGHPVGRLVARGLDDELTGTPVSSRRHGQAHHHTAARSRCRRDGTPGSIVELRKLTTPGAGGASRWRSLDLQQAADHGDRRDLARPAGDRP